MGAGAWRQRGGPDKKAGVLRSVVKSVILVPSRAVGRKIQAEVIPVNAEGPTKQKSL